MRTPPLVVAHRGGAALSPENTLAACRRALAEGVDAIEVDVRLSADGVPVVLHDATLERTTNGRGRLSAYCGSDLARLDATAHWRGAPVPPEPPPRLDTVVAVVGQHAALHVELKGSPHVPNALIDAVARVLEQAGRPPVVLSFDWSALRRLHARAPDLERGALLADWPRDAGRRLAVLRAGGVRWLGLAYRLATPRRLAQVQAATLRVGLWTVNHPASLRRALRLDVDAITTDRPDRLRGLLAS